MSVYKIKIIRSVLGNFTWHLMKAKHNGAYAKIAEAPQMYSARWLCDRTTQDLARSLRCEVVFFDMEKDFEE